MYSVRIHYHHTENTWDRELDIHVLSADTLPPYREYILKLGFHVLSANTLPQQRIISGNILAFNISKKDINEIYVNMLQHKSHMRISTAGKHIELSESNTFKYIKTTLSFILLIYVSRVPLWIVHWHFCQVGHMKLRLQSLYRSNKY